MRKTKRVIAALTAAIITATSTSLMSVCADENGGSDFGFVSKSTTNKSDNIEAVESNAQLYEKLAQLLKQGDSLKYGEALYTTGTPDGEKWTKEFYEQRVEFYGEDLLSKYIVDGEFLRKSVESDMNGLLNKTENELDKYVDIINEYLISNSIAGSAYAIKNDGVDKLLITYDGQLEKIQAYIAEIGVDDSLVVYDQAHDMVVTKPATTIAVTETKPVTTITMPVVDEPTIQTAVVKVTIMDVSGDNILVKPVDGSSELNSSDKFYLSSKKLPNDIKPKVGMKLEITYNGNILETYPAQFGNVKKVVEVKEDTVKEDPTLLKGTKDMTLNDVMRFAELGDDLDWADFRDYNGKDVGSGLYIWEYKLEGGFVLDVGGDIQKKPIYILLSHDNDKGIDIRTEDVKEYIASTATPVSEISKNSALQKFADDISTYMMANSIAGDAFVHDDKVIITYSAHEDKIKAYVKEKGIDENVVVYEKGKNQEDVTDDEKEATLKEYAADISNFMIKSGIAGDAFVHDGKVVVTYSAYEDKIKAYVKEKGIDENVVVYEKGKNQEDITDDEKEATLKEYAADISNFMIKSGIAGDAFVHDDKVVVTYSAYEDKIKTYVKEKGIDENIVVYEKGQDQNTKGDANCDGQVDLSDAVMIMQALANPNKYGIDGTAEHHLTEQGKLNGDMNGDGLTVGDAQAIQRKLLGLDSDSVEQLEKIREQLSDFFIAERIDYAVIPKDKMPEQFADKYVFIKVNTADTGSAARYGAFLKSSDIDSSLIKSIPYKIDSDTELNKIRTLLYCYILENNINASVDPTDEEADLINKTVLVKYADSEKTREQLENFIKEKNIDLNLVEFFAVE